MPSELGRAECAAPQLARGHRPTSQLGLAKRGPRHECKGTDNGTKYKKNVGLSPYLFAC